KRWCLLTARACADVLQQALRRLGDQVGDRSSGQLDGTGIQHSGKRAIDAGDASCCVQQQNRLGQPIERAEDFLEGDHVWPILDKRALRVCARRRTTQSPATSESIVGKTCRGQGSSALCSATALRCSYASGANGQASGKGRAAGDSRLGR